MAIGFAKIPSDLRIPLFWAEIDASRAGYGQPAKRTLLIGQTISSVTAALRYAGSAEEVGGLCGEGSQIARMARAYRRNDPVGEMWILPLADNGSGVAASGSIEFTGPTTAAGVLSLYIGGRLVSVSIASGTSASDVAAAVEAAIDADPFMPVTTSTSSATVTLAAKNDGTEGNSIDIRVNYLGRAGGEVTPAGLGVTITAMSSGATNPSLSGLETALGDEEFEFIVIPWSGSTELNALKTAMDDTTGRWAWSRQIYGHAFSAARDSAANLLTLGAARNDPHMTIVGYEAGNPMPAADMAAAWAGATAVAIRADPARPLQTLPLVGMLGTPVGSRFTRTNQQSLLSTGIALPSWDADGTGRILRSVTTYQKNAWSQTDRSYLDCETLFTLAEIIRRLRTATTTKFGRSKLANDGTRFGPGQPIVTPRIFKAELVAQYEELEAEGLVEDAAGFAAATIVERNAGDPSRLDVLYAPNLVNGLRVLAVLAQFRS